MMQSDVFGNHWDEPFTLDQLLEHNKELGFDTDIKATWRGDVGPDGADALVYKGEVIAVEINAYNAER